MASEDRYANSPRNKGGKVEKPEAKPKAEAEKTAGSPPSAEDPKGAISGGGDKGPTPGETPMGGEMAGRHKSEIKDMLARHKTEHEQMIGRHHEEIGKMHARHAKETEVAPNKDEEGATKKVEGAGEGPKLGSEKSEGKGGSEP